MYVQHGVMGGRLGEVTAAPFACPPCAYFTGSHCAWCPNEGAESIPECQGCKDRQRERTPWYKSQEFLVPVASAVVATLVSAVLLSKFRLRS